MNPFEQDTVKELKTEAKSLRDEARECEAFEKDKKRFLVIRAKNKALEAINESFDKNDLEQVDRLHWLLKNLDEI